MMFSIAVACDVVQTCGRSIGLYHILVMVELITSLISLHQSPYRFKYLFWLPMCEYGISDDRIIEHIPRDT